MNYGMFVSGELQKQAGVLSVGVPSAIGSLAASSVLPAALGAIGNHPDDRSTGAAAGYGVLRGLGSGLIGAGSAAALGGMGLLAARRGMNPLVTSGLIGGAIGGATGSGIGGLYSAYNQDTPWWKPGLIGTGIGAALGGIGASGVMAAKSNAEQRSALAQGIKEAVGGNFPLFV